MNRIIARRRMKRMKKAMAIPGKSEKEHRRELEKKYSLFPLLLSICDPDAVPRNNNKFRTQWQKNLYKEAENLAEILKSYPDILACYYDAHGLKIEVSKHNCGETLCHIKKHLGLCSFLSVYVNVYAYGSKEYTAGSPVHRVSNGNVVAMLTGLFGSRFIRETGVTAGHLFHDWDPELEAGGSYKEVEFGGGIKGRCCAKASELVICGKMYTADLGAFSLPSSPKKPISYDQFGKTDINGRMYQRKLWTGDKSSILPETEVWMMDQDGKQKIGTIHRILFYDKELDLYNVMQIRSKCPDESFSEKGDSGCCVFIRPRDEDDVVHVIGMVSSKVEYEMITLTNAVELGTVLPHFVRTLAPSCFKEPHRLSWDDNLPQGVDYAEALDFCGTVPKFENLQVKSDQLVYPKNNDTGISVETGSKDSGPSGCVFQSFNRAPNEISEESQTANSNSDVLESVDTGIDTLTSLLANQL